MSRMYSIASCLFLLACNARHTDMNEYAQSIVIHNSMVKKAKEMEQEIHLMLTDSTSRINTDSVNSILADLQEWKNQLIEVPGNESHDHTTDHHDHEIVEITPEQVLLVQQSLDDALGRIGQRLMHLKQNKDNETIQPR